VNQVYVLYPVIALAALTFVVLCLIPYQRFKAASKRLVVVEDFKHGESASVPGVVSIPNRNYMNLLEAPMLFYVACFGIFITQGVTRNAVALAWAYVALRAIHSIVHLTYNNVFHRLTCFALSNVVLVALWVQWVLFLSR
jgi:hypothetical protein